MNKLEIVYTKQFKKDSKKLRLDIVAQIEDILDKLANNVSLEPKHKDHPLSGNMRGFRDCHIKPDLVLIYEKREDLLILKAIRVGSHSEVFS